MALTLTLLSLAAPATARASTAVALAVPWIAQGHPLSCEEASLSALLHYEGLNISQDQVLGYIGADLRAPYWDSSGLLHWGDGFQTFVGNVDGSEVNYTGLGALVTPIAAAAQHFGGDVVQSGQNIQPSTIYAAVAAGDPAETWVTYDWQPRTPHDYLAFDGRWQPYVPGDVHVVDVIGVTDTQVLISDPDGNGVAANHRYPGQYWIQKSVFEAAYNDMTQMALIIDEPTVAPSILQVWAGPGTATLDWQPTQQVDDDQVTGYVVQAQPGGQSWTFGAQRHATVSGLTDGTSYTFRVGALTASGLTVWSPASPAVTPPGQAASPAAVFTAVGPLRLCDTRSGEPANPCSGRRLGPDATITLQVTGAGGVPAKATSAVLNVTAVRGSAPSVIRVYPSGAPLPQTSNLNLVAGQVAANLVNTQLSAAGSVDIHNDAGQVDVVVDLEGYFAPPTAGDGRGRFVPVAPVRILDTRLLGSNPGYPQAAPLGPGSAATVRVAGAFGVPAGAAAVVLNLTTTQPSAPSYLQVYPPGSPRPTTSNLNFAAGQTIANRVYAPLAPDGTLTVYNSAGSTEAILDLAGYFLGPGSPAGQGDAYVALPAIRVMDSRPASQIGPFTGPLGATEIGVAMAGLDMVPAEGGAGAADAVVMNVTAVLPSQSSVLEVFPSDPRPVSSDLNFPSGAVVPNEVVVRLGSAGSVRLANAFGTVDVIFDVAGYFTAS